MYKRQVAAPGVAAARAAAVAAAAAGVSPARGGGGAQEAIRPSRWWSRIVLVVGTGYVCLMGRKQLSLGVQTGKTNEKTTINVKKKCQRMHIHLLVRENTWAGL